MNVDALKTMQVVCVDDEQEALEQMHLALNSFCKTTVCVSSTEKALLIIDELRPDIVLTDVRMPGASGLDLLEAVKKKHPSIAVIIVSAHSESEYLLDAIRLKADGYLLKPLNLYEMLELLSSIATQKTMKKELDHKNFLLSLLNSIGGKRVQIIEYIISHLDDDLMFHGTYDEVAEALSASKPTVVNAFQILMENNVLTRVKNGVYKMNTSIIGNNGH
ncbi:response regulator [Geobacter sulfurreducens]|uniref:response regulator n=1 Tax=Geobacter sulfurreducens TaxID=35554 RepID=UPI0001D8F29B|nr:response regulator [Geobacter sulfurreducens]ADI85874.1 response regulator [Geobacter sulfurreducens KN400]UTG92434.1 response regulator [Geobacter sulfurreducens]